MDDNKTIFVNLSNDFSESPYIDYEDYNEDSVFLEWYSIEGENQIKELSRQLRTFLNYKSSMILLRYSKPNDIITVEKRTIINQHEKTINNLASQLINLLKTIRIESGGISEYIIKLLDRLKIKSIDNSDIQQFKKLKKLTGEIWKLIHIISELEIHHSLALFKRILTIVQICCEIEIVMMPIFSNFFQELRMCYIHLEDDIIDYLEVESNNPTKQNKISVKIYE